MYLFVKNVCAMWTRICFNAVFGGKYLRPTHIDYEAIQNIIIINTISTQIFTDSVEISQS